MITPGLHDAKPAVFDFLAGSHPRTYESPNPRRDRLLRECKPPPLPTQGTTRGSLALFRGIRQNLAGWVCSARFALALFRGMIGSGPGMNRIEASRGRVDAPLESRLQPVPFRLKTRLRQEFQLIIGIAGLRLHGLLHHSLHLLTPRPSVEFVPQKRSPCHRPPRAKAPPRLFGRSGAGTIRMSNWKRAGERARFEKTRSPSRVAGGQPDQATSLTMTDNCVHTFA